MKSLILASGSPRRKELLTTLSIPFSVHVKAIEEVIDPSLSLGEAIEQIAYEKAMAVFQEHKQDVILAADTIVCINGRILGKPHNDENARTMLKMLSNQVHQVITGVAIISNEKVCMFHESSEVTFYDLSDEEIENYIKTQESHDKAGAYAIQGKGAILVAKINGDYYNIVGLPIARVYRALKDFL